MKKRVLSILLVLCMVLTLLPFGALAEDISTRKLYIQSSLDDACFTVGNDPYTPGMEIPTLVPLTITCAEEVSGWDLVGGPSEADALLVPSGNSATLSAMRHSDADILIIVQTPADNADADADAEETPEPTDAPDLSDVTPGETGSWNGHTYQLFNGSIYWSDAEAFCESMGGHLATITSAEEQAFVESLNDGYIRMLGGFREQDDLDGWQWVTGEPWDYTNWADEEPNNSNGGESFLVLYPQQWNDLRDNSYEHEGFICEWDDPDVVTPTTPPSPTPEPTATPGLSSVTQGETASWNGHTYQIYSGHASWSAAEAFCESMGGHLATITSEEEQAFLESLSGSGRCWIG